MSILLKPREISMKKLDEIYDIIEDSLDYYILTANENVTEDFRIKAAHTLLEKLPTEYRLMMSPVVRNIFSTLHNLEVGDYSAYYKLYLVLLFDNERAYITHPFTLNTLNIQDNFVSSVVNKMDTRCVYTPHSYVELCKEGKAYNNDFVLDLVENIVDAVKPQRTKESILDLIDEQFSSIEAIINSRLNDTEMVAFISRVLELKIIESAGQISELDLSTAKLTDDKTHPEVLELIDTLYGHLDGELPSFKWYPEEVQYSTVDEFKNEKGLIESPDKALFENMKQFLDSTLVIADDLEILDDIIDIFVDNLDRFKFDYRDSQQCIDELEKYIDNFYANV